MKQNITQKQWDEELTLKKQLFFIENTPSFKSGCRLIDDNIESILEFPSIGHMIEFLGDDMVINSDIEQYGGMGKRIWIIKIGYNADKFFEAEELCDALWKAVEYKLT